MGSLSRRELQAFAFTLCFSQLVLYNSSRWTAHSAIVADLRVLVTASFFLDIRDLGFFPDVPGWGGRRIDGTLFPCPAILIVGCSG